MVKNLLFSLALAAAVSSLNAQGVIKPELTRVGATVNQPVKVLNSTKDNALKGTWMSVSGKVVDNNALGVRKVNKAAIDAKTSWWDYSDDATGLQMGGYGVANYRCGVAGPTNLVGAKVDSVSVYFLDATKLSNVKIWIKKGTSQGLAFPTETSPAEIEIPVDNSQIVSYQKKGTKVGVAPTKIKLPETFVIPKEGFVLGYSLTTAYNKSDKNDFGNYPIVTFTGNDQNGGFYLDLNDGKIYNQYGSGDGNLTLALHADVTGLSSASVQPVGVIETVGMLNKETEVGISVKNTGFKDANSLSYILTVNGQAQPEQTVDLTTAVAGSKTGVFYTKVTPTQEMNSVSVEITKVNGIENTATTKTATDGVLVGLSEAAERTSVVEEATGVWCGYCPRGHVGMKKLKEDLGDKVITLASHFGDNAESAQEDPDAMSTANLSTGAGDYTLFHVYYTGGSAPSALFDRTVNADPYIGLGTTSTQTEAHYGATDVVKYVDENYPSEADFQLTADWADNSKTAIKTSTTTTFKYDRDNYPYGIVYVLSEDGMKDPNPSTKPYHYTWAQANYYAPEFADYYYQQYGKKFTGASAFVDDDMKAYTSSNSKMLVADQVYDHVIVGAWAPETSLQGLSLLNVTEGYTDAFDEAFQVKDQPIEYSQTLTLSPAMTKLIQDKSKLSIAALLVNVNNGQIVNAKQLSLGTDTGINGVVDKENATNATEVARYNANGQLLKAPQKGLNIIKLSNGKSLKVVVK